MWIDSLIDHNSIEICDYTILQISFVSRIIYFDIDILLIDSKLLHFRINIEFHLISLSDSQIFYAPLMDRICSRESDLQFIFHVYLKILILCMHLNSFTKISPYLFYNIKDLFTLSYFQFSAQSYDS